MLKWGIQYQITTPVSWLIIQEYNQKEKIVILGPFVPQTMELTSSESGGSVSTDSHPRIFSPISVPIPSYEDCFQAPHPVSDIFNQLEYESSLISIQAGIVSEIGSEADLLTFDDPLDESEVVLIDTESEHRQIVRSRLEALVSCKA